MTQLDLPQISLQRYVELLKRRRWQVVPASLLGLLIGGLVAFFIPRYYVANALLVHQMAPGVELGSREDPFRGIVETARITIPLAVGETMERLEWPEAAIADPFQRSEKIREVKGRLRVDDYNARPDRTYAQLGITYKDLDGERAAAFLNTLVAVWKEQRVNELRTKVADVRRLAAENHVKLTKVHDELLRQRTNLETRYELDPRLDRLEQAGYQRRLAQDQKDRADALARLRPQRAAENELLEKARAELAVTDERVPASATSDAADPATRRLRAMVLEKKVGLLYWLGALEVQREHTPAYRDAKKQVEKLKGELEALGVGADGTDELTTVPNPKYLDLERQIAEREARLLAIDVQIAAHEQRIAEEAARLPRLAEGYALYDALLGQIEEARSRLDTASDDLAEADRNLGRLQNERTVEQVDKVWPPPHPTDPNILVVALIGCVLGLGFAIALILLLDVLQGSFKTIDEIERTLAVPVLGGQSHLETDAERFAVRRGRRRWSMLAAAMLLLSVVVITVYYRDPTSLPASVRDLLALLLGA